MTATHADQLIDGYLARLQVAAADLPSGVRDELIEDMRAHIAEARTREPQETDATILNILDRLGEPDAVVAEAGRRPDVFGSSQPSGRPEPYRPGILEIAAVVLLPFLWPVGGRGGAPAPVFCANNTTGGAPPTPPARAFWKSPRSSSFRSCGRWASS